MYKLIKFKDPAIIAMMIFMNLTIFTRIIESFSEFGIYYSVAYHKKDNVTVERFAISGVVLTLLFMEISIILNLNKWASYYVIIREHTNSRSETNEFHMKCINYITIISIIVLTLYYILITTLILIYANDPTSKEFKSVNSNY